MEKKWESYEELISSGYSKFLNGFNQEAIQYLRFKLCLGSYDHEYSYKPSFIRFCVGHVKTLVELIWNDP